MRCSVGITDSIDINLSKLQEVMKDMEAWHAAVHGVGHNLVTEQQSPAMISYSPQSKGNAPTKPKIPQSGQSVSRDQLFVTP